MVLAPSKFCYFMWVILIQYFS